MFVVIAQRSWAAFWSQHPFAGGFVERLERPGKTVIEGWQTSNPTETAERFIACVASTG